MVCAMTLEADQTKQAKPKKRTWHLLAFKASTPPVDPITLSQLSSEKLLNLEENNESSDQEE